MHPLQDPFEWLYTARALKEVVPEKHQATRSNRPDSAVLSCPNTCAIGSAIGQTATDQVLAPVFGQDGQKGNLRRTTVAGVFHILSTPLKNGVKPKSRNRSMTMHANSLVLDTITVRQHNGMFSLNDLHKAAGDSPNHRPGEFIRNQQTQELVAELSNAGISAFESRRGHSGGTYACRELVIAYAAWISAAFHLKVIRVFLAAQTAAAQPQASPAIDYDRISPAQQQDLQELVQLIVASGKQGYGETWRRFHNKFKVAKYDQLPSERFDDAVAYLKGKLDADALLQLVSRHLDARIPLIVESVSQMVGTLAQDAMKQLILSDNLVTTRYVSGFSHDRERGIAPAITPVRRDQNIMSVPEMLHELEGGWFGAKPDQVCNALTALSSQLVRMSRTPARA